MSQTPKETLVTIGLGGNIEPRIHYIEEAERLIGEQIAPIHAKSRLYESEPWGFEADVWFLNCVVQCKTSKTPKEILKECRYIEQQLHRKRRHKGYESRTIDVDILLYGDQLFRENNLLIPHPRIAQRLFVLKPMLDVEPEGKHPLLDMSWAELIEVCEDRSRIRFYEDDRS